MYKRQELGREPAVDEVFLKTHTRKEDRSSWVDERSKRTYVSVINELNFFFFILRLLK